MSPDVPHALGRRSLANRIALISALCGLIVIGGGMVMGSWALSQQLDQRSAAELVGKRALLLHILSETPTVGAVAQNAHRFGDLLIGHDDLHLALVNPATGEVVAGFSPLARQSVAVLQSLPATAGTVHTWTASGTRRLSSVWGPGAVANGQTLHYYLSVDRRHDASLLMGFLKATLVGLPVLLLLVALSAGLTARAGLAPLLRFNRVAASISAQSLSKRLSPDGLPMELATLAREFNAMLGRIDEGYRRLEEFSGDLAHEIRTPMATLLGRSQVALSQSRSEAQLREVIEGNVEEMDRLSGLIADMLFLATADHKDSLLKPQAFELAAEAQRVSEYFSLVGDERGVKVEVSGKALLRADRLLIERAITNLVSNAVRHADPGSTVHVTVTQTAAKIELAVRNRGPAIAPEHLDRIFDRFFRIDSARSRHDGGTGLGLAIVRSIMTAHGGRVTASSEDGGDTVFRLSFPA